MAKNKRTSRNHRKNKKSWKKDIKRMTLNRQVLIKLTNLQ